MRINNADGRASDGSTRDTRSRRKLGFWLAASQPDKHMKMMEIKLNLQPRSTRHSFKVAAEAPSNWPWFVQAKPLNFLGKTEEKGKKIKNTTVEQPKNISEKGFGVHFLLWNCKGGLILPLQGLNPSWIFGFGGATPLEYRRFTPTNSTTVKQM